MCVFLLGRCRASQIIQDSTLFIVMIKYGAFTYIDGGLVDRIKKKKPS